MSEDLAPRPTGRPPRVLAPIERQRLTAMAAKGLNQSLAGARLGVSDRTLREILKRDPEAHLAWNVGRAEAAEEALELLWKSARDGQPAAQIFLGKCLAGLRETAPVDGASAPVQINFVVRDPSGSERPVGEQSIEASFREVEP